MKICKKCGKSNFFKCGRCKECDSLYQKKYNKELKEGTRVKKVIAKNKRNDVVKTCIKCGSNNFKKNSNGSFSCAECIKQLYEKNKDYRRERDRKNKDKINESRREWYAKNKERALENSRKWRENNPDKMKSCVLSWRQRNPRYNLITSQNRRKKVTSGKISTDIHKKLYLMQKGKCACCGELLGNDYHLDHIMPLSLGGKHEDRNMQLLKSSCNLKKYNKHPIDYMQSKGFLL